MTITIEHNPRRTFNSEDELVPNTETLAAFKEIEERKTHRYKSAEDMFNKVLGKKQR